MEFLSLAGGGGEGECLFGEGHLIGSPFSNLRKFKTEEVQSFFTQKYIHEVILYRQNTIAYLMILNPKTLSIII